jgi:hypothetical protein
MRLVPFLALALALLPGAQASSDGTDTFALFKCTVSLPVVHQTTNAKGHQVLASFKLDGNDLVNLTLGRSLDTKLDKATEVLAFASDQSTPGAGSRLVILNPSTHEVTATVFFTTNFVLVNNEDFTQNDAFADAQLQESSLGDPAHDALHASTIAVAGSGKSAGSLQSTAVAGPVSFTFTDAQDVTSTIEGVVLKGKLKVSGPQLESLQLESL